MFESSPAIRQKLEQNSKFSSILTHFANGNNPNEKINFSALKVKGLTPDKKKENGGLVKSSLKNDEKNNISNNSSVQNNHDLDKEGKKTDGHKRTVSYGLDPRKNIETKVNISLLLFSFNF